MLPWSNRFRENDNPLERLNKSCDQLTYKHKENGSKFGTTRRFAYCLKRHRFDFKCEACQGVPV